MTSSFHFLSFRFISFKFISFHLNSFPFISFSTLLALTLHCIILSYLILSRLITCYFMLFYFILILSYSILILSFLRHVIATYTRNHLNLLVELVHETLKTLDTAASKYGSVPSLQQKKKQLKVIAQHKINFSNINFFFSY